jgi:hypothetical protein
MTKSIISEFRILCTFWGTQNYSSGDHDDILFVAVSYYLDEDSGTRILLGKRFEGSI